MMNLKSPVISHALVQNTSKPLEELGTSSECCLNTQIKTICQHVKKMLLDYILYKETKEDPLISKSKIKNNQNFRTFGAAFLDIHPINVSFFLD